MPKSISISFGTAVKTGLSRWFKVQTIPHNLYVSVNLTSLYCGLRLILDYPKPLVRGRWVRFHSSGKTYAFLYWFFIDWRFVSTNLQSCSNSWVLFADKVRRNHLTGELWVTACDITELFVCFSWPRSKFWKESSHKLNVDTSDQTWLSWLLSQANARLSGLLFKKLGEIFAEPLLVVFGRSRLSLAWPLWGPSPHPHALSWGLGPLDRWPAGGALLEQVQSFLGHHQVRMGVVVEIVLQIRNQKGSQFKVR